MMNKRRILGIVVVLVIGMIIFTILSSKNNISTEEKLSQIESERKPDNYIPANIKMKAKDFTVYTENKEKVNIEKYIGSKPMVIVFWASWCIDCRENLIKIEAAKEKYYKEDVEYIYRVYIERISDIASDRKKYKSVCKVIKNYKKLFGDIGTVKIVRELKAKYMKRPAFIDELSKI